MYFFKCSIILFRSSEKPGALCRPDGFLTLLHSSKLSSRGEIILIVLPSLRIMLSVLFMFNLLISSFTILLRCSWCRSHGMFLPGALYVLTHLFQMSS